MRPDRIDQTPEPELTSNSIFKSQIFLSGSTEGASDRSGIYHAQIRQKSLLDILILIMVDPDPDIQRKQHAKLNLSFNDGIHSTMSYERS